MKLEHAQETLLSQSPLQLSQQFSRDDLLDLREQLKAKREGLIASKDKCTNGHSIAVFNVHLAEVKTMTTRINQTIAMMDMDAKIMKKNKSTDQELAIRFLKVAKQELDTVTFNKIKNKAMVA